MTIDARTRLCCLIGDPVMNSLSPVMHNAAFSFQGINNVYVAFRVRKEGLRETIEGMRELDILGMNVTIPYKKNVMEHLDEIDPDATEIGAVNTILNKNGVLKGYNTDWLGAMDALANGHLVGKGKALLIGAGEAARAVGHALAISGKEILIANRTMDRANALAADLRIRTEAVSIPFEQLRERIQGVDLIVNCTPVGMKGFESRSPLDSQFISREMAVFDIVYNPMQTELLKYAREKGARVVYGYEMFIGQGARSYEIWTGRKAPVEEMRRVVLEQLRGEK
jgi:shikimate dehydrogenase